MDDQWAAGQVPDSSEMFLVAFWLLLYQLPCEIGSKSIPVAWARKQERCRNELCTKPRWIALLMVLMTQRWQCW